MRFFSATFFCARKNAAHFSLSGAKKRQLQPERYTKIFLPRISGRTAPFLARGIFCFIYIMIKIDKIPYAFGVVDSFLL
jgi:hypothetical protein